LESNNSLEIVSGCSKKLERCSFGERVERERNRRERGVKRERSRRERRERG
jgi:hypothetical protein